jgi:glucose/arabinose dehydrogenase
MKKIFLLIAFLQCSLWCSSQIVLDTFAIGLTSPVDIKHTGDDRIFVVQQGGTIKILDTSGVIHGDLLNISSIIVSGGEQGLLGLAFDPDYAHNGFFYVNYTAANPFGETHISRFQVSSNPDSAILSSERILLRVYQPFANHNGGHVAFGPDGYLYIGMGDGGAGGDPGNRAQNLDSLLGKILRIDVSDTSVDYINPPSNPFVGIPGRDEIWDYGVRNPWRWSFDTWNGDFWIGDVGQGLYEEIDFESATSTGGLNYGWHCYEGNHSFDTTGCNFTDTFTFPVLEIPHDSAAFAITGGYVYRGAEYSNLWGKYFFSDLNSVTYGLHFITHIGNNFYDSLALHHVGQFVSFGEDKYGELYIADYGGIIYKIRGAACSPNAVIHFSDTLLSCDGTPIHFYTPEGRSFHYQWFLNGNPAGSDSSGLDVTTTGDYTVMTTDRNGCTAVSSPVHVSPCLSINENQTILSVSLYPNPNNGVFTMHLVAKNQTTLEIEIRDMLGKIITEKKVLVKGGSSFVELQNSLAKGVYTLKLNDENEISVRSFVVN